ncbi:MAG: amino acid ABC transporter [Stutzerimonas stutzeri]|nr:MAG: amino acid ABC transporter [Stutzerimonas stutzeri]
MDIWATISELATAVPLTLGITFAAMAIGFCLALVAAALRIHRIPVVSHLFDFYVSYGRSVPVVLQLFGAFYALPLFLVKLGFTDFIDANIAAIIGLSLYHGAYLSEVIRPAYLAVDSGQHEAALSLGYDFRSKLTHVIAPQASHIALPGYGNSLIYLIHNVAIVMYIGAADVMATAHLIMERDHNQYQFETYLLLAIFYSVLCLIAWLVVRWLERRSPMYAGGKPVSAGGTTKLKPAMLGSA